MIIFFAIVAIIYGCVMVTWFFVSFIDWSSSREFPDLYDHVEISNKARRVVLSPIWPVALLEVAVPMFKELLADARGLDNDRQL